MQAALKENPDMKFFASPWSPPGWMKESGIMDAGDKDKPKNVLRSSPEIYKAYGLYFAKYFEAYAAEGVILNRLVVSCHNSTLQPRFWNYRFSFFNIHFATN